MIKERLESLREKMKAAGVSAYYITTADHHASEYVSPYFKVREFFSGFTGSNGDLLILPDRAVLWTDGRYFVQAEQELKGSGIELFKMGIEGFPTVTEFLKNELKEGDVLSFDGRCVTTSFGKKLKKAGKEKGFSIRYDLDLSSGIFIRPECRVTPAEVLSAELTGETVSSKLDRVREALRNNNADSLFLTKLDDIAYLFNVRGRDIEYNPVVMSYAYISFDMARIFLKKDAVNSELIRHLSETDTRIMDYDEADGFLEVLPPEERIMLDPDRVNYYIYKTVKADHKVILKENPTEHMKAVKNYTEIENLKSIYLKDCAALTRFILRLSRDIGKEAFTENSASELLLSYRKEIPEFLEPSFTTISAYGKNAAMMHYDPAGKEVRLEKKGMLLVDSGGQYMGGTTDITRTIVLGDLTDEEKRDYTLTAASMLNLMNAKWLKGCTGRSLDILARQRMWDEGMDYKCGTGHGVGYMLNVHEGPQNIRFTKTENEAVLESGMCVTDEPGVYKEGKHGIRIENHLVVKDWKKTDDGQFLEFGCFTYVPIDDKGIDKSIFTEKELKYYLDYQREVCEKMKPYLSEEEYAELLIYSGQK